MPIVRKKGEERGYQVDKKVQNPKGKMLKIKKSFITNTMPINKKMMDNMKKEYGAKKAKGVYYGLENKMKKEAPEKAKKVFNLAKTKAKKALPSVAEALAKGFGRIKKRAQAMKVPKALPAVMKDIKPKKGKKLFEGASLMASAKKFKTKK